MRNGAGLATEGGLKFRPDQFVTPISISNARACAGLNDAGIYVGVICSAVKFLFRFPLSYRWLRFHGRQQYQLSR